MNFWKNYWKDKQDGGHRNKTEGFLHLESEEKIFHMGKGDRVLDFGCGAGELTTYFATSFREVFGIDFSKSMLSKALERATLLGLKNVNFLESDLNDLSLKVLENEKFDVITSAAVIQYFTIEDIKTFLKFSNQRLRENGKVIFFDVIHPELFNLFLCGVFSAEPPSLIRYAYKRVKFFINSKLRSLNNLPEHEMGYAYNPYQLLQLADEFGYEGKMVSSMYYEYRFHIILWKKK